MIEWYFYAKILNLRRRKGGEQVSVKVKRPFFDREHDLKLREPGEVLEVNQQRAQKLISMKLAEPTEKKADTLENLDIAAG